MALVLVGLVLLVGSGHSFSTVGVRRSLVGKWGSESSVELGKQQHLDSSCLRRELVMSTLADVQPNVNLKLRLPVVALVVFLPPMLYKRRGSM